MINGVSQRDLMIKVIKKRKCANKNINCFIYFQFAGKCVPSWKSYSQKQYYFQVNIKLCV